MDTMMDGKQDLAPTHNVDTQQGVSPQQVGVAPQQQIITQGWQQTPTAQQQMVQVQPQAIVVQVDRRKPIIVEKYNSLLSKRLGIVQLTLGGLAVVLSAFGFWIQIEIQNAPLDEFAPANIIWTGLWGSFFTFLSGGFAIRSAKMKTRSAIRAHLGFAIMASLCALCMFGMFMAAVIQDSNNLYAIEGYDNPYYDPYRGIRSYVKGSMAVSVFLFVVSVAQVVACIWSSTLGCRALCCDGCCICCCCCEDHASNNRRTTRTLTYTTNTTGQSQEVMVVDRRGRVRNMQVIQVDGTTYPAQTGLIQMPQTSLGNHGPVVINPAAFVGFQQQPPAYMFPSTDAEAVTMSQDAVNQPPPYQ